MLDRLDANFRPSLPHALFESNFCGRTSSIFSPFLSFLISTTVPHRTCESHLHIILAGLTLLTEISNLWVLFLILLAQYLHHVSESNTVSNNPLKSCCPPPHRLTLAEHRSILCVLAVVDANSQMKTIKELTLSPRTDHIVKVYGTSAWSKPCPTNCNGSYRYVYVNRCSR